MDNAIAKSSCLIFAVSGIYICYAVPTAAQIIPDNTLGNENSVVNLRDENSDSIDGGAVREQNLFHSFEEFNVDADRGVYFANPEAVTNIFSRVTGSNISNILGTLGVDGAANLFLINPNGIVFGEGASLDLQGSFTATTANGIRFGEQGEFNTINPQTPQLLTINPSAYLFNQVAPGAIVNNSRASANFNPTESLDDDYFGLRVPDGQNLLLLGGDVNVDGGGLVSVNGRIDLGAVTGEGVIGLNNNGSLNIADSIARGDVSLTNGAGFLVGGDGGGDIAIAAKNIDLLSGSSLNAGIFSNSVSPNAQAGDITIDAAENLTVDNSIVANLVNPEAVGNAGNINITTGSLNLTNEGKISANTFGRGNTGNIKIDATNLVEISNAGSWITSQIASGGSGEGGDIELTASNLTLQDNGQLFTGTFGEGNAGDLTVTVADTISLDNTSSLGTQVNSLEANGNSGQLRIETETLSISGGSFISSSTFGQGDANDITIKAGKSIAIDGSGSNISSQVNLGAFGNAGNINLETTDLSLNNNALISTGVVIGAFGEAGDVNIKTSTLNLNNSASISASNLIGENGGNISIDTNSLKLNSGSNINTFSGIIDNPDSPQASASMAGQLTINAVDSIEINGANSNLLTSFLGLGSAGQISLNTKNLLVANGGLISSSVVDFVGIFDVVPDDFDLSLLQALIEFNPNFDESAVQFLNDIISGEIETDFEQGDSGDIIIEARESISLVNGNIFTSGTGNALGGDISISTPNFKLQQGSVLTNTAGSADSGMIKVNAELVEITNGTLSSGTSINSKGNGGTVNIFTQDLLVQEGGEISTSTLGKGDAGNIKIQANTILVDGFDSDKEGSLIASEVDTRDEVKAEGDGGNIEIIADSLSITNKARISASTFSEGNAGNLSIFADNIELNGGVDGLLTGLFASVEEGATGQGGSIFLGDEQFPTQQLTLNNGAQVIANTFSEGDAGNLFIFADNIDVDGFGNFTSGLFAQVGENATGQGGNINFGSEQSPIEQLNMTNGASISVSTFSITDEGNAGNLSIFSNSIELNGEGLLTGLFASVTEGARGQGGNIFVNTDSLTLTDGGRIAANVEDMAEGNGGTLEISANDSIVIDGTTSEGAPSAITSVVNGGLDRVGGIGNAGAVTITTSILSLINGGRVSATSLGQGNGGDLTIYASESIFISGFAERFRSGISASAFIDDGNSGDVNISTNQLTIENGGTIEASNFDSLGVFTSGTGEPGNININANSITLKDRGRIDAATQSDRSKIGNNANINLKVADNIILRNNSFISAQAFRNANGGNIIVDTEFIIAFPNQNNDIIASAEDGDGGNISITAESLFGIEERLLDPQTNDISASSNFGLNGNVSLNVLEIDPLQGTVELPDNLINTNELVANSCLVPSNEQNGTFVVTGGESLPVRPGGNLPSKYPTGEVRGVSKDTTSSWQPGDPIIEPQGAYRLANGKMVLSRECL